MKGCIWGESPHCSLRLTEIGCPRWVPQSSRSEDGDAVYLALPPTGSSQVVLGRPIGVSNAWSKQLVLSMSSGEGAGLIVVRGVYDFRASRPSLALYVVS